MNPQAPLQPPPASAPLPPLPPEKEGPYALAKALLNLCIITLLTLASAGVLYVTPNTSNTNSAKIVATTDSTSTIPVGEEVATPNQTTSLSPSPTPAHSAAATPSTAPSSAPVLNTVQKTSSSTSQPTQTSAPSPSPSPSPSPPPPSSGYKDGTFSASANYTVPGNTESITVTTTLSNGMITAVSISQLAKSGTSAQYQSRFASGYQSLVVGKSISNLSLSRVSGASLTTNGFNSAISKIRTNAKA